MKFHLDEHVSGAIARGLRLHGIDVTTTSEAGLIGATDTEHLAYALSDQRVIVTQDEDFLSLAAATTHGGIAFCRAGTRSVGEIIRYLILIDGCMTEDEMNNHIEFL